MHNIIIKDKDTSRNYSFASLLALEEWLLTINAENFARTFPVVKTKNGDWIITKIESPFRIDYSNGEFSNNRQYYSSVLKQWLSYVKQNK